VVARSGFAKDVHAGLTQGWDSPRKVRLAAREPSTGSPDEGRFALSARQAQPGRRFSCTLSAHARSRSRSGPKPAAPGQGSLGNDLPGPELPQGISNAAQTASTRIDPMNYGDQRQPLVAVVQTADEP
jgi:hypothetical protein